jgi:hypothetical protein
MLQSLNPASMCVGSHVPGLTKEVLINIPIVIPTNDFLLKFEEVVSCLFENLEKNIEIKHFLINLLETLLLILMKGEIEIKD